MSDNAVHADIDSLTFKEYKQAIGRITVRTVALCVIAGEVAAIVACSIFHASLWTAIILPAAALVISLLVTGVATRNRFARNRSALAGIHYTFDAKGFSVSNGKDTQRRRWDSVMRMDMNGKCIFIYPNRNSVNVVPRRCLAEGDGVRIMSMYQAALPKKDRR